MRMRVNRKSSPHRRAGAFVSSLSKRWTAILGTVGAGVAIVLLAVERDAPSAGVTASPTPATARVSAPPTPAPAVTGKLPITQEPGVPPLPPVSRPARPWPVVREAYAFAAGRPDVLWYVPCFCGCERHGHRSNHDCFVAARDGGRVLKWDAHGVT